MYPLGHLLLTIILVRTKTGCNEAQNNFLFFIKKLQANLDKPKATARSQDCKSIASDLYSYHCTMKNLLWYRLQTFIPLYS